MVEVYFMNQKLERYAFFDNIGLIHKNDGDKMKIFTNSAELNQLGNNLANLAEETKRVADTVKDVSDDILEGWIGISRKKYGNVVPEITSAVILTQGKLMDSDTLIRLISKERDQIDDEAARAGEGLCNVDVMK